MPAFTDWIVAFLLTLAIEAPLAEVALRRSPHGCLSSPAKRLLAGALPSALTHPLLWFVWWPLWQHPARCWSLSAETALFSFHPGCAAARLLLGELLVVLAEAAIFRVYGLRHALLWSLGINTASVLVGLLLHAIGWL